MKAITVVLIEPQAIFLRGVVGDLESADDIEVLATARTTADGLDLVRKLNPDVIVTALEAGSLEDVQTMSEIDTSEVLILTAEDDEEIVFRGMMIGAGGYLLKWSVIDLADCIRRIHNGDVVMCNNSLRAFLTAARTRYATPRMTVMQVNHILTPREREVLEMVAAGRSQFEIADGLNIALATVKTHLRNTYLKLEVKRSAAAVQRALELGAIDRRRRID